MSRRLSEAFMSCLRCLGNSTTCGCIGDNSSDEEQGVPAPAQSTPAATGAAPAAGSNQQPQPQTPLQISPAAQPQAAAKAAPTTTPTQPIAGPSGSRPGPRPRTRNLGILEAAFEAPPRPFEEVLGSGNTGNRLRQWMKAHDPLFDNDPALAHLKYNKFQDVGAQRSGLLEDQVKELGLPDEFGSDAGSQFNVDVSSASESDKDTKPSVYLKFQCGAMTEDFNWEGSTGPGIIVIDVAYREPWSATPRHAYVTKAIYEYKFSLQTLEHVFVTRILNVNTRRFISERLYTEDNNLTWPADDAETKDFPPIAWENGTAEYDALLGTAFGKIIAYLVLSAYPRVLEELPGSSPGRFLCACVLTLRI
ncbi:hypothetical protein N7509_013730 [Penicillium cosmopolitanum]|uniref:Uncharacterized protein n=1 Tax=Penicillium cosmopolitanum TaxID=1131564 RepID=A0A9W9SFV4_9EURO|nr:uncharacterized protein N7509_013730 [Penicillium cosmopolitanum]KAJ5376844.1 hypothetical protein N7509_013730 [Penicillium cosmopolitanum]